MLEILSTIKPEVFIQGGAVLVAMYLIYSHILKDKQLMKLMTNHFDYDLDQREKDNASRDKNTKTLQMLIDVIKSLKKK